MQLPPPGEVHVWAISLDRSEKDVGVLGGLLTADELLLAAKIVSEEGRSRQVVSRAGLRVLLGRYLDASPAELAFSAGARGKPHLEPASPLRFNLSHSGGLALIAVAHGIEVGVDVEEVKPRRDLAGLARRIFAAAERETIESAPDRERAFYRHWVAKEAFVKATGRGVASLRSLEVLLEAPGGARIVHVAGDVEEAGRWTLEPLDAGPGYTAAAVAEGRAAIGAPTTFDPLA
jgi:4'-phosphopantetheinyl transferase